MLIEDVHFTRKMPPVDIGKKSVACSISDIAAMGGVPKHILVSFGASGTTDLNFTLKILKGMKDMAERFSCVIVGGDTVRSKKIVINVSMTGEVEKKSFILRSGAQKKDKIFVTGPLGNSLKSKKHLRFVPRVKESQYLIKNFKPTSMIDISDGLIQDLKHILDESNAGAFLNEELIPLTKGANVNNALYDGEDFELLFTLRPEDAEKLAKTKSIFKFYEIGEIADRKHGLVLFDKTGSEKKIKIKGFVHF